MLFRSEHVVSLILFKHVGQQALVAVHGIIDERYARYPVAMLEFAVALNVVLPAGKVPHEIAPVHEVHLIRQEEAQIGALMFAGVLRQIAILCVAISFLTRNFARDITVLSKILEWQFLLQIVVRNVNYPPALAGVLQTSTNKT